MVNILSHAWLSIFHFLFKSYKAFFIGFLTKSSLSRPMTFNITCKEDTLNFVNCKSVHPVITSEKKGVQMFSWGIERGQWHEMG